MWRKQSASATTIAANRHCRVVCEPAKAVDEGSRQRRSQRSPSRSAQVTSDVYCHPASSFPPASRCSPSEDSAGANLFPNSDVDLLILIESDTQVPAVKESLSTFLQTLWDSGLRPSHSVHTVAECIIEHEQNAELTISLLDRRLLAGDAALFELLDQNFGAFIQKRGEAVARQLATLAVSRRAKYQNTIYHLEPNVKDTPGGLRDLQTVRWLAVLHPRDVADGDSTTRSIFLAPSAFGCMRSPGRDQNVLSFDSQEALSDSPAELMRDYYRHAGLVDRAARHGHRTLRRSSRAVCWGVFTSGARDCPTPEFSVVRDQVLLRSSNILPADLSLFVFAARHKSAARAGYGGAAERLRARSRPGRIGNSSSRCRTRPMACERCRSAARCRRAAGVAQHRMPGGPRFLSSLHRG